MSARHSKELRIYYARAKAWKEGRVCVCDVLLDSKGNPICNPKPHACTDVHHKFGRLGPLLLAEEFWIPVCWPAHHWIGHHIAEAKRLGLIGEGPWNTAPKEFKA